MSISKPLVIKYIIHLLFWFLFTGISLVVFSEYYWTEHPFLQFLLILIGIVYINTGILLPYFIKRRWYVAYVLLFGLIAFIATQLYCQVFTQCGCSILKCMSEYLWQTLVPLIFFSFIWMLFQSIEKQEELERIIQAHTAMELKFLKSQIDPHVLLNNLNTIYSYSLEKPNEVPDLILMLSENLKHVLYESNTPLIPLEKELKFIDNYMAFQALRTAEIKTIDYQKPETISNLKIAPLLLITIIENAFKYSTPNSTISIAITTQGNEIKLYCNNEYEKKQEKSKQQIGLDNLKKRLRLIYPNQHTLAIKKGATFTVELSIELNE